jgi:hypothetical protein
MPQKRVKTGRITQKSTKVNRSKHNYHSFALLQGLVGMAKFVGNIDRHVELN